MNRYSSRKNGGEKGTTKKDRMNRYSSRKNGREKGTTQV